MMHAFEFVVSSETAGNRLDAEVFCRCPASTRALVRRTIAVGGVTVNGRVLDKGDKLHAGDVIVVRGLPDGMELHVRPDPAVRVDVVYEDAALIAVNKPAGMACHPLDWEEIGTVANGLAARYPELIGVGDGPLMAGVLHRLDGGTSGLVLAARTQGAYEVLREQFRHREVEKRYVALVEGVVSEPGHLEHDLSHQPSCRGRMVEAARLARHQCRPMRAVTEYRPVRQFSARTLLEVSIRTGVTHQIRCQLALSGHPVVGDTHYGAAAVADFPRHFLHAATIRFHHPLTGVEMELHAPLTADLVGFLAREG